MFFSDTYTVDHIKQNQVITQFTNIGFLMNKEQK